MNHSYLLGELCKGFFDLNHSWLPGSFCKGVLESHLTVQIMTWQWQSWRQVVCSIKLPLVWVEKMVFIQPMACMSYLSALSAQIWCTLLFIRYIYSPDMLCFTWIFCLTIEINITIYHKIMQPIIFFENLLVLPLYFLWQNIQWMQL